MFIIVEGPDGAGKSTVVKQLEQANPSSILLHFGAPKNDEEAYNYYNVYAEAILKADPAKLTIFDRAWYSDMVYAPVMRHREEMTELHAKMLSSMIVARGGGMILYCTAPVGILWSRCVKRGETYITSINQLREIAEGYTYVMRKELYLPVIRYDTSVRW